MTKLVCPKCENTLIEEGEVRKPAQYNYRVYLSQHNNMHEGGKYVLIECLVCHYIAKPFGFEE